MIAKSPPFSLLITRFDRMSVIRVVGEVDMSTRAGFSDPIKRELRTRPAGVIVDLRKVQFFGSSGLQVLLQTRAQAEALRIGLCLVADTAAVLRPLELTGLTELFIVHKSVPEAAAALAS